MLAISEGIGSGAINEVTMADVINEPWCEFMTVDVKLECSDIFINGIQWVCPEGIAKESMKMLNDEFNHFRGLFPLKVIINGPPASGKTFFAAKLCEEYGIPHLTIQNIIDMGMALTNDYGKKLKE